MELRSLAPRAPSRSQAATKSGLTRRCPGRHHRQRSTYARDLVADGRLGRVTSATVHAARSKGAGGRIPAWAAYPLDRTTGAGTSRSRAGTRSTRCSTCSAASATYRNVVRPESRLHHRRGLRGRRVDGTDHLLLNASLVSGAVVSAHIPTPSGPAPGPGWRLSGTEGDLAIVSTAAGVQIGELRLRGADAPPAPPAVGWRELPIPGRHRRASELDPAAEGFDVAPLYARLALDLRTGSRDVPDCDAGLRLHCLLDAIGIAADTGTRRSPA